MAIVFATVAMVSFAIDQALILAPDAEDQGEISPPSLLHPVLLIESLIDAASEASDHCVTPGRSVLAISPGWRSL
jgi:hypothetical protein